MSVFKKIDSNDVNIIPFNVHKEYTVTSNNYSGSGCGLGVNFLCAQYYSHSFGDPQKGTALKNEPKNKMINKIKCPFKNFCTLKNIFIS